MRSLNIAGSNSSGATDLNSPAFRGVGEGSMGRNGPMRSTPIPFTLQISTPYQLAAANPERRGLILQNKDAAADLYFSFGGTADLFSAIIAPRASILLDFVCPTDAIWVFATAAVSGWYCEFARIG